MDDIEKNAEQFLPVVLRSMEELPDYIRKILLALAQTANQDVNRLFFPEAERSGLDSSKDMLFDEWSVRYAAMLIALSQSRPGIAGRIRSASYDGIQRWVLVNRIWAGRLIYAKYLKERLSMPDDILAQNKFFDCVVEHVTQKDYILLTKAVSAVNLPVPAQLVIEALQSLHFVSYGKVITAWQKDGSFTKTHPDWDLLYLLEHYPWLDEYMTDVLKPQLSGGIEEGIRTKPDSVIAWVESPMGPQRYGLLC